MFWEKLCVNNNPPPNCQSILWKFTVFFFQNVFLNFKVRYEKRLWTEFLNGNILCHSILKCLYFSLKCITCNCLKSIFFSYKKYLVLHFLVLRWLSFISLGFPFTSSFLRYFLFCHLSMHTVYLSIYLLFARGALWNLFQICHRWLFLGLCLWRWLGRCDLCHPIHAAVLHLPVSHFVSRAVTRTAICKSFSVCNSLFSGVPLVLYVNVLRERVWDWDDLAVKRAWNLYTCHLCVKLMLQRIAYK